ncbi:hypothetical protein FUA23_15150 [Neolewinella aurantiaca]|uniref:Uncharacterized protein n=1 Tax=Neolewinella aurantiaca TaxID=2602767 RepID=A0A5C7FFG0_9BACT|nr:hypothetical protein [Neolewinella aurantiaca]TXF88315.1 hypothetical protein FUA23_15150 [Neolewinella aurantiaca]
MPSKDTHQLDFNRIISDIFPDIDPTVVKDNDYLHKIQRNCMEQANPFACYFTLLLGSEPRITWRHNTARHFGILDLQYEEVFTLIHPSWLFAYVNYAKAMYQVALSSPELVQEGASAGSLIPMRHRSGDYYWYHQISVKVANDGPLLAAHVNYYHQSSVYGGQLPDMPKLTTSGEVNKELSKKLNVLALEFLPDFLAEFLSDVQIKFILEYRQIIADLGNKNIPQRTLMSQLETIDTLENLSKVKQRIKQNTIAHFQHPLLNSARSLALWLNRYFPLLE